MIQIHSTEEALNEMRELKDATDLQHKAFMKNLEEVNKNLVQDCKELRDNQSDLWTFSNTLKVKSQDQTGQIEEMFSRMQAAEKKVHSLDTARVELETRKCD